MEQQRRPFGWNALGLARRIAVDAKMRIRLVKLGHLEEILSLHVLHSTIGVKHEGRPSSRALMVWLRFSVTLRLEFSANKSALAGALPIYSIIWFW